MHKIKFWRIVRKMFLLPIAIFFALIILLLKPVFTLKLIDLPYNLGDLLFCVHYFETQNKLWNQKHLKKRRAIYCAYGKVTNKLISKKLRQSVFLLRGDLAWVILKVTPKALCTVAEFEEFQDPIPELMSGLISFSKSEESYGSKILRIYGDNFVCLNVRDSAYDIHLGRSENFVRRNRNSKIEDFESLIQYLVDKNITVFRMGVKVNSSPNIANVRFVDYAKNGLRSELLDLFLGANCKFAVSTSTGWDAIPELFLRPLLLVNVLDIFRPINLARRQLVFPKIFWSVEKNRPLTLDECISVTLNLRTSLKLGSSIEIGLEIRDLSSEELVEAVTEMAQRVEGTFVETPEQKEMQAKLKHILSTHPKLQPSPNYYPIRAQFASCFLSRYPNFLDGLD